MHRERAVAKDGAGPSVQGSAANLPSLQVGAGQNSGSLVTTDIACFGTESNKYRQGERLVKIPAQTLVRSFVEPLPVFGIC